MTDDLDARLGGTIYHCRGCPSSCTLSSDRFMIYYNVIRIPCPLGHEEIAHFEREG